MNKRHVVTMYGTGGQGVLLIGQILAKSACKVFKHVTWSPMYDFAKRGGTSECVVGFSNDEITSPWISQGDTVIAFDTSKLDLIETKVRPGGKMIVESINLGKGITRTDIGLVEVPALTTATKLGNSKSANLVLLGAYVAVERVVPPEVIETMLGQMIPGNEEQKWINLEAFRKGMQIVEAKGR